MSKKKDTPAKQLDYRPAGKVSSSQDASIAARVSLLDNEAPKRRRWLAVKL